MLEVYLKLAIFQKQLSNHFDSNFCKKIPSLSLFLCVFYVKYWLCSPYGVDAPKNDLVFLNELNIVITKSSAFPEYFSEFAMEGRMKLMDHLWYLSERLVPFCLFSDKTNTLEKQSVRQKLLKNVSDETRSEMSIPDFDPTKTSTYQLQDFVGPNSWTFLEQVSSLHESFQKPVHPEILMSEMF